MNALAPFRTQSFRSEAVDHPRCHIVDRDERRRGHVAIGQRLEYHRGVEPGQRRAADIFLYVDAAKTQRRRLSHYLDGEVFFLVPARGMRRKFRGREGLGHVADRALVFGRIEVHLSRIDSNALSE